MRGRNKVGRPSVLCVCLGNICRSPLAEGLLKREVRLQGLDIFVDSAGTSAWHLGELADPRAREVGERRGYPMDMRARQIVEPDFDNFDLILAMDYANVRELRRFQNAESDRIWTIRSFDPQADDDEVPDPYYGGVDGFEAVADMLEATMPGLLAQIRVLGRL